MHAVCYPWLRNSNQKSEPLVAARPEASGCEPWIAGAWPARGAALKRMNHVAQASK